MGWSLVMVVTFGVPAGAQGSPPPGPSGLEDAAASSCAAPATHGFNDVPTNHFANLAVGWLVGAGITSGTSPGKFSPNDKVTRAQMAVFLWRNNCPPPSPSLTLAAGLVHTCALKPDATVACWGNNGSGELGDGTIGTDRLTPTPVAGLTDVTAITAGAAHTCALNTNRTVKCWGNNSEGQVGDGATIRRLTLSLIHISEPTRPY